MVRYDTILVDLTSNFTSVKAYVVGGVRQEYSWKKVLNQASMFLDWFHTTKTDFLTMSLV